MDAYSRKWSAQVLIKRIVDNGIEWDIVGPFSQGNLDSHPKNHVVPFYGLLPMPGKLAPNALLVTPLLWDYNRPDFDTVGQFIDFVGQALEVNA
jgi:hypothetical protein